MASKGLVGLWILLLVTSSSSCTTTAANTCILATDYDVSSLNRSSFPTDFVFGTASSAYQAMYAIAVFVNGVQYEGAASEGGKGPSIWDYYTHKFPEKIKDGSNGDVAVDAYHRYKEDVGIIMEMNLDAYRFSISWTRLLPNGKLSGGVNKEGMEYYNNLINELLAKGLKPYVTLFHWDVPQSLEDEYGGFLSPRIVKHFREYTELCFREFGDRVKHWITLNEPWSFSSDGYAKAGLAPYRCSEWQQLNCTGGDSGTEPYIVAHHLLLSHAAAVKIYKDKYQASQKGLIGVTLVCHWRIPFSDSEEDRNATLREIDFVLGWFMDPLTNGDYPHSMRSYVGKRLPKFSEEQSKLVKGSFDFVGLNYYSAYYASHVPPFNDTGKESYITDPHANLSAYRFGIPIGEPTALKWLYVYPKGFYDMLLYTKEKYHNPLIYISENGFDELNDPNISLEEALMDYKRIDYHYRHLYYLQKAIKDGVNVKGYFAWSLLDNFEWSSGYTVRFGFNYVDHKDGLMKRYPKLSAHWFKAFLQKPHTYIYKSSPTKSSGL